jgi:hypothetical protein
MAKNPHDPSLQYSTFTSTGAINTVTVNYLNGVTQSASQQGLNPDTGAVTNLANSNNSSLTINYPGCF